MSRLSLEMWYLWAPDLGGSDPVRASLPKPGHRGCIGSLQLPGTPAPVRVLEGLFSARPSGLRRGLLPSSSRDPQWRKARVHTCVRPHSLRGVSLSLDRAPYTPKVPDMRSILLRNEDLPVWTSRYCDSCYPLYPLCFSV